MGDGYGPVQINVAQGRAKVGTPSSGEEPVTLPVTGDSGTGQLDLFQHSRAVMLFNDVVDSVLERNTVRVREGLELLRAESPPHPALDALWILQDTLERWPIRTAGAADTARTIEWLESLSN